MFNTLGNSKLKRCVTVLTALIWTALAGCNIGNDTADSDPARGDLKLRLLWQERTHQFAARQKPAQRDVCKDFRITYIRIRVNDASGKKAANTALLPCTDHSAQLKGIRADKGYTVMVEGVVDGKVLWRGTRKNVEVTARQVTAPVTVTMTYNGKEQQSLWAAIEPKDGAVNVPTDVAVRVTFNQEVVAASITKNSVQMTCGDRPASGTLTYHPDQREALFEPENELPVSTTCTVAVTTDVVDMTDRRLPKEVAGRFSTTMVWYVDGQSAKSGSGKSWKQAFSTIAEAVAAAGEGHQIWVRRGTYKPEDTISIDKPVELLGGFYGDETQHHQRDWKIHKTVVDGNGKKRGFDITADAVIDGFSMTGFQDSAMSIIETSPKILNCVFNSNATENRKSIGGAIRIDFGDPIIKDCAFYNNKASSNFAAYGGAIYNNKGGPEILGCVFTGNGVAAIDHLDNLIKIGCLGGAIYNEEAKIKTSITNCKFIANTAFGMKRSYGGAISSRGGTVTISECWFSNNKAEGIESAVGGAIDNDGDANIRNSIFYANSAGSMASTDPTSEHLSFSGGAISFNGSGNTMTITNCTFLSNNVEVAPLEDADIAKGGAIANYGSRTTITNSILWGNRSITDRDIHNDETAETFVTFSNIDQHYIGKYNISQDPRLTGYLRLRADSPCRAKGDPGAAPEKDIDGEPRPTDRPVDMGADQFLDNDEDDMPDYWEALHKVDLADIDEDDDKLTNLEEYLLGTDPHKPQQAIDAYLRGAVAEDGARLASDLSLIAGSTNGGKIYRSFFVFDVSNTKPIKGAALRLELAAYSSDKRSITIQIKHVGADADALSADTSEQSGIEIFEDLGKGLTYGEFAAPPSNEGTVLNFDLNPAAVEAINAAISDSGVFVIGVSLTNESSRLTFGTADESGNQQLVLIEE